MATPATGSTVQVLNPDGSVDWYRLTDDWVKVLSEPPIASLALANHTHPTHGDINFTGAIQAGGYDGVNGRFTVDSKKLTFKEGICIAVEDI